MLLAQKTERGSDRHMWSVITDRHIENTDNDSSALYLVHSSIELNGLACSSAEAVSKLYEINRWYYSRK